MTSNPEITRNSFIYYDHKLRPEFIQINEYKCQVTNVTKTVAIEQCYVLRDTNEDDTWEKTFMTLGYDIRCLFNNSVGIVKIATRCLMDL